MLLTLPVGKWPTDWVQPMNGDGICILTNHHWCKRNRRGLSAMDPGFVDQINIAVHPSYLIGCKMVCTVIICNKKVPFR